MLVNGYSERQQKSALALCEKCLARIIEVLYHILKRWKRGFCLVYWQSSRVNKE